MATPLFVQLRCTPGCTYDVASEIAVREFHSELYSTSGEFDLLIKIYPPENGDVGQFINQCFRGIPGIERTMTTLTFKAF